MVNIDLLRFLLLFFFSHAGRQVEQSGGQQDCPDLRSIVPRPVSELANWNADKAAKINIHPPPRIHD
jgi:hypothetical protein